MGVGLSPFVTLRYIALHRVTPFRASFRGRNIPERDTPRGLSLFGPMESRRGSPGVGETQIAQKVPLTARDAVNDVEDAVNRIPRKRWNEAVFTADLQLMHLIQPFGIFSLGLFSSFRRVI